MMFAQFRAALLAACVVIAGGGVASSASAASERLIKGGNPDEILTIMRGFGSADLDTDPSGDPLITGRMEGILYSVYFYGCRNGRDCDNIQFYASWQDIADITLADINAWNTRRRFGRAYIEDGGDVTIEMDVNLDYGVTAGNLDDSADYWRVVVTEFSSFLDDPSALSQGDRKGGLDPEHKPAQL